MHAVCDSFGARQRGQGWVPTAVAFHCARRVRVLARDIRRFGTATGLSFSLAGRPRGGAAVQIRLVLFGSLFCWPLFG